MRRYVGVKRPPPKPPRALKPKSPLLAFLRRWHERAWLAWMPRLDAEYRVRLEREP